MDGPSRTQTTGSGGSGGNGTSMRHVPSACGPRLARGIATSCVPPMQARADLPYEGQVA